MEFKKEYKDWSLDDRVVSCGLYNFEDGYIRCSDYENGPYESKFRNEDGELDYKVGIDYLDTIKSEDDLMCRILDKEEFKNNVDEDGEFYDGYGDVFTKWDDLFDKYFSDCEEWEVFGNEMKIVVDKENKSVKIMAGPLVAGCWAEGKSSYHAIEFCEKSGEIYRKFSRKRLEFLIDNGYILC